MLPVCRTPDDVYAIPPFEVTCEDVEGFLDELGEFHALFRDCFVRREPREHFFRYMLGQFSSLERKSIEPIAVQTEASSIRAMQRSLSDTQWHDARMRQTYHQQVAKEMGAPDGVIIVDESGFVKKGQDSVGVARQYCGTLGKVDNCQVGVFAAYASRQGYALVDTRLFLPEQWWSDAYASRRAQCAVPKEVVFQTKPQLAAAMVRRLHESGTLPFRYIAADCLYGNSPEFWAACEACVGTVAFVAVPEETRCWLAPVATTTKSSTYKGERRTRRVVTTPETAPQSVAKWAQLLGPRSWYRRTVSEGTKGPIVYEFARKRVTLCKDDQPAHTVWLVIKRTLGAEPTYWYYISNAPVSTPLRVFVWLSGVRWAIDQGFEETKTELGMAHYELRKYSGWHHHMLTCMLAHFFLWHVKMHVGKKSPSAHGVAGEAVAGEGAALENFYPGGGPPLGAMDAAAPSCGVSVASKKSVLRRLIDDQQSPLTDLGTTWQDSLDVWDENGLRLDHNFLKFDAPFFWLLSRPQMGLSADPRGLPDRTAQSTTTPRAVPPYG
jgi:SRSO17 transposase